MKHLLIILLSLAALGVHGQTYYIDKITVKVLEESITIDKEYQIKREGLWVYFDRARFNGSEGWAFEIIDSTKNKTYVLDYHWITTFDSLQISEKYIRLFNRTHDEIIYHFY